MLKPTTVNERQIVLADVTTDDVSTSKHGFAPKLPNDPAKFLNGIGSYTVPPGTGGSGTVISILIASANGLAGTSDGNAATPTLTFSTTVTGILKGNGTAISAAVAGTDYLTGNQTITLSGSVTGSGATAITTAITSNVSLPGSPTTTTQSTSDSSTKVATTAFVQGVVANAIAGVNPAVAVFAATAAKLPNSPSYNNGASGVGAFITTATLNTPLVVDGQTANTLNVRVLVKNEGDAGGLGAADNGVYYLSQVSAVGLPWILTRALDFDQPSDINNTGAIPVLNGTANAGTSWVVNSTVNTVGTDAITFTQFSLNPSTLLSNSLTSAFIFVGNGSNQATGVAVSGDVTITNVGAVTIANNAITTAKINANAVTNAKMATSTANTLAGYDGSGNFSDVAIGAGLALASGTISVALLTPTTVKTSAYNAVANDLVPVDCSSGSVTITLPSGAASKTLIGVKLIAVSGSNTCTVTTSGGDTFNITGGPTTLTLNGLNESVFLEHNNGGTIWYVLAGDQRPGDYTNGTGISITTSGGTRTIAVSTITESNISLSDVTTDNVSTSAHGFAPKAPNDATQYLDGTAAYSVPGSNAFSINYLLNTTFSLAQRQKTITTYTTPSYNNTAASAGGIDGYGADRWKAGMQTATMKFKRVDSMGAQETGLQARFYGSWQQQTGAGKFILYQPLEASQTYDLDGRVVVFQILMKASSSKTIRLGLIQLNSSGTADTIPALMVPTTWGANSTDPTLGTNLARVAPTSVPSGCQGTVNGNAVDCSVTTAWQLFGGKFTVPSDAKNIMPAVWTDSQFSANDILSTTQADLHLGSYQRAWMPIRITDEILATYRYCQAFGSEATSDRIGIGQTTSTGSGQFSVLTKVTLRVAPTIGYSTLGSITWYDGSGSNAIASFAADSGNTSKIPQFDFSAASGTPFTQFRYGQAYVGGGDIFYLEADL